MTKRTNTGGHAFPTSQIADSNGMTLRDYFAAKAMQSMVQAWISTNQYPTTDREVAVNAYALADAMLDARND